MSLVEHARRELKLCGQYDEDPAYAQSVVAAVAALASYGQSGGSASCAVEQLTTLLQFGTLSPLTSDPQEWMQITDELAGSSAPLWQSRRNPQAFSNDAGTTYYLLDEVDAARQAAAAAVERPMHTAEPPRSAPRLGPLTTEWALDPAAAAARLERHIAADQTPARPARGYTVRNT